MRQMFHTYVSNDSKSTVDRAKQDIGSAASEMGFISQLRWTVQKVKHEGKEQYRVEGEFTT